MSDEIEYESGIYSTPQDEQNFEPLPLMLNNGGVAIFDQVEFGTIHNCLAVKFTDGDHRHCDVYCQPEDKRTIKAGKSQNCFMR